MYIHMHGADGTEGGELDRPGSLESVLGHDLTNHLQVIELQAGLLAERLDDAAAVERLEAIQRQTVAANSLVKTVCRVGPGPSRDQFDVVDLGRVLREEVRRTRSAYPDADVSADVPEELPLRADDLVASLLWNLLQNAVRHGGTPTPRVRVTARSLESTVVVAVEDDGPGLPDDVEAALLGDARPDPGSGVGVVRSLADRYDATVSVDAAGGGTTITLEFPRGPRSKDS